MRSSSFIVSSTAALIFTLSYLAPSIKAAYNEAYSKKAVFYAGASYCLQDDVLHWDCGGACSNVTSIEDVVLFEGDSSTFGYAAYNAEDNEIIVSFRGTRGKTDLDNWVKNLEGELYMISYEGVVGAEVHPGFYNSYKSVQDQVRSGVKNLISKHNGAKVLFTGHSLGGAITVFAAADLATTLSNQGIQFRINSFGCPRTGNKVFSDYAFSLFTGDNEHYRVVHYDDTVPHLPDRILTNYIQTGNEVWYYDQGAVLGDYKICLNSAGGNEESDKCSGSFIFKLGIDAHLVYLGYPISRLCNNYSFTEEPEVYSSSADENVMVFEQQ